MLRQETHRRQFGPGTANTRVMKKMNMIPDLSEPSLFDDCYPLMILGLTTKASERVIMELRIQTVMT